MSTSGPDDPSVPSKPSPELGGLDPKDLLNASLETVPPVTLPPQPVDPAATIPMSGPRPTLAGNKDVDLPLPEELSAMLPPGAYHVESFLGQGGMGAVYKGTQVRLKRPVAIKIMRRDLGKDHDFEARFEREAQAMAKLNHPNIVSVIDYGEAGPDYLYIVMELVDGADLMDVIRGGQMTQEMALSLLPQICDALQFAHDHGIVHRDIKPSNIMLTRDGRIKMADFGLAKHFDAESSFRTQTGTGMGTPDYAAPEQFSPDTPIDHRADIYALGVMIYQMITGQLPRGAWKPPSQRVEVAPQWDNIVSRAMQNDPADRYQQASEVKTDVSSIPLTQGRAAGPPAAATGHQAALGGPSALPQTKSRAPLLIGLVVGAAALTLGAFIFMKEPAPANSEAKEAASTPASAPVSSDAQVSRTQVTASAIQWQKAGWTAEDLRNKTLVADGDWARIGEKAGASNGWRIGARGQTVAFKDGVVRLRYRWEGAGISLKTRNENTFGEVKLWGPSVDLGIYLNSAETRLFQKVALPRPLKVGDEGTLEIVAIGNRLYARLNDSIVFSSPEIPELAPSGYCSIQSVNASFRDIEYANLDGIPDPLKALGWEVPDAVEAALASVSPAVRPYVAYPERLKVPVPDWLRLASAEGGSLRIHTVGDPGPAKAALDLGEAARFDDFVFVAGQDLGWIAVRRNGELWGRNADYKGQPKSVGPIQIKSLSTGRNCHWLEEDGTGGCLYGVHHHRWPVSIWGSERVTAASLHSAVASFLTGKVHRLAFDSAGNLLAHFSEVTRPDYQFPPSDWFRGAPQPKLGDGLAALTHDGRVRTWDFTTGAAFPGMEEVRDVVQLAYGSGSAGWGVMLSETGQATVFGSKGTEVPEDLAPPAKGGPFIRVSPGPIFAAQKTDGSWVGWNSKERDLVAAIESFGPATSIASVRVSFRDGDYAEKPVNIPYLIYIQPKNGSKPGVSNAPAATTTPANVGEPLVAPLTWLPAVHSEGNAAKYHSQTPDGWITGTPDNPGGITASHPAGPLGNFVVRLRYRWNKDARHLQVRVRHPAPAGVAAQAVVFDGHWAISKYDAKTPPETRSQSLTTRKRTAKLEPGSEGMLEVAVIGDRMMARFDNTTLLDATVTGMATRGVVHISSAGLSFRDVEMVSLDGIADPLKALGWEVPLNWQKAAWSANEVAQKKIVVEDGWARIGQAAGALEKTWKLAVNDTPVPLGDGAVRLSYRYEGRALTLKIRNHTTYGYVTLWPYRLDLGIWSMAYAEREKRVQTRAFTTPLKDGEEGVLELAADGRRLFARLNGSIVLTSDELPDLGLTGGCEIQSDGVSFRDVEYVHLGGIADPLKELGWEVAGTADWHPISMDDARLEKAVYITRKGDWLAFGSPPDGVAVWQPFESNPRRDFADVAIRCRYKWKGGSYLGLGCRYAASGAHPTVGLRPSEIELKAIVAAGSVSQAPETRPHAGKLAPEDEGMLELAVIGDRVLARLNGSLSFDIRQTGLASKGLLNFRGSNVWLKDFEYFDLDGISDPLKALGWVVAGPASATKDAPFVNSLGMKFVPVPITGGPTDKQHVLFSIWETRVQDYEAFLKETRRQWPKPEFEQGPKHPAVNLQWFDAAAYCAWLTERERKLGRIGPQEVYRLPTDHEWSCAVGAGDKEDALKLPQEKHLKLVGQLPWGAAWPPPAGAGNFSGEESALNPARRPTQKILEGYRDEFIATAEVGSFPANRLGIFDLAGNAWEWCEDWFDASKAEKVFRGGAWDSSDHGALQVSSRFKNAPINFNHSYGFRVVLAPAAP